MVVGFITINQFSVDFVTSVHVCPKSFTDLKLAIGNDEFDESLADCRIHLFSAVNVIPKLRCALILGSTDRPHRSH